MTINLTTGEIAVLKELLAAGERGRTCSGLKARSGFSRLVKAGYVLEQAASMDALAYVITKVGRQALAGAER
jgi:hypothetical protein